MKHVPLIVAEFAMAVGLTACVTTGQPAGQIGFKVITEGYDWGPGISRLVIDAGRNILASSVEAADFSVYVERKVPGTDAYVQAMDWATMTGHDSRGDREVVAAYVSDADGQKSDAAAGRYITLTLKIGPDEVLSSPFNFDIKTFLNSYVTVEHTITQTGKLLAADGGTSVTDLNLSPKARTGTINLLADRFDTTGVSEYKDPVYGDITLRYASYQPAKDGVKHPLVIWLHGAGEGGTDPNIVLYGNRVTALVDEPIQRIFGGAFVLTPQTPIVWMNNGKKSYPEDGTTQYTGALKHLIDAYVASHPDIDTSRVYLGGCSNGGYMTMNMVLRYPDYFAAAWPICEAYADRWISDQDIANIKDLPIWFTQAKTDTTVKAAAGGYVVETYQRLMTAGAGNVHLTYWDRVEDLSGRYFKADGHTPYEYNGHWSWIYTLNNQCALDYDGQPVLVDGRTVTLMEWLALQSR